MCRWICFQSKSPVLLADLLIRPHHSIINQSFDCRLRLDEVRPLNADGFGVGWYPNATEDTTDPANDGSPCIFTSVLPAWNNPNLSRLANKIKSTLVFCHVRAASPGFPISEANCHPWAHGKLMFQHNGYIAHFNKIKRALQAKIPDDIYNSVHGNTDSEWAFALFLSMLKDPNASTFDPYELKSALLATIATINTLLTSAGVHPPSSPSLLNFAVTDGHTILCTRYTNCTTREAASLYWSSGSKFTTSPSGESTMEKRSGKREQIVVIASEPLTFHKSDWCKLPDNTLLMVGERGNVLVFPIEDEYWDPSATREPEVPWWTVAGRIRLGTEE
ncbi:glutamine amidotransferase [Catenaria anguillulae PL171]|uniref:Glutamine amidotransferase n=1 Tax=Catenaria anguillulae PL171 TaxID=765915 RepID=A0A1Y2HGS6_9FUNG|nr:glutamine amidotransferase [Catenaria anguillulae PL171]